MTCHPASPEPARPETPSGEPTPVDQPGANTQHYRDVLCELVDIGTDIARMFHAHARLQHQAVEAGAHPLAPIDFSVPFDSLTRAIRRTIALAQKLDHPPAKPAAKAASPRQIIPEGENAIERQPSDDPRDDLRTRLDAPDLEDDIEMRPIADIITEICRDLGLDCAPGSRLGARVTQHRLRTYSGGDPPMPGQRRKQFFFEKKNQKTFVTQGSS